MDSGSLLSVWSEVVNTVPPTLREITRCACGDVSATVGYILDICGRRSGVARTACYHLPTVSESAPTATPCLREQGIGAPNKEESTSDNLSPLLYSLET